MTTYMETCDTKGCTKQAVAVVKDDPINGEKCCVSCLEHEGEKRGWW